MIESDPSGLDQHTPGAKMDAGKLRAALCFSGFSNALNKVAEVTTVGAKKYTPNGWKDVADGPARYHDAALRHLLAVWKGETVDSDTGCDHMAQVLWNFLAMYELSLSSPPAVPSPNPERRQPIHSKAHYFDETKQNKSQ